MHSVKYPDLKDLIENNTFHSIKDKIYLDIERGNVLINKAILHHNFLENESCEHRKLSKRYGKIKKATVCLEVVLTSLEVGMSGIAILASPILPVFGIFALGAVGTKLFESWATKKFQKHKEYYAVASCKVKSLEEHFIKSMEDGTLSENEYKIIKKEVDLYLKYKNKIQETIDNDTRFTAEEQELLQNIRKLLHNTVQIQNNLKTPSAPPAQ